MIRKLLLLGAFVALTFFAGAFMAGTTSVPATAAPLMSTVPHVDMSTNVQDVARRCGPWNNWCRPRVGGCIMVGGVRFCVGSGGTRCHWYNGVRYCRSGPGPGPAASCIRLNGHRYCNYKHRGDCVRVNRVRYCRF